MAQKACGLSIELIKLLQCFEDAISLLFVYHFQRKANVNQNVVSDTSLRCVIQTDIFRDPTEIHSASTKSGMPVLKDAYDSSWNCQAHAAHLRRLPDGWFSSLTITPRRWRAFR